MALTLNSHNNKITLKNQSSRDLLKFDERDQIEVLF